jgi:hypothetical protein
MHRFTTSAATERSFLVPLLLAELVIAVAVIAWPTATQEVPSGLTSTASVVHDAPGATTRSITLKDGRTAELMALGMSDTAHLTDRIAAELDGAADAVTAFWGDDWPRRIVIVAAGTDEEFLALGGGAAVGGGAADIAATTTAQRITFAPGAAKMGDGALRIVLRHELLHYAARAETAPDASRWLTEGVADFVGRPPEPRPGPARAAELAELPTDADLDTAGATRSLAYDRAWWFSRFVADRYGMPTLRKLYQAACGIGHVDVSTAIHDTLGADVGQVVAAWRQWLSG